LQQKHANAAVGHADERAQDGSLPKSNAARASVLFGDLYALRGDFLRRMKQRRYPACRTM
jgi:hypothetical protein